jgi:hypothetical protein
VRTTCRARSNWKTDSFDSCQTNASHTRTPATKAIRSARSDPQPPNRERRSAEHPGMRITANPAPARRQPRLSNGSARVIHSSLLSARRPAGLLAKEPN